MLLRTLAVASIVAMGTAARAEEAARIVDEKVIFEMSDDAKVRENRGVGSMRLSPDGTNLLYIRRCVDGNRDRDYKLIIRDIKAAKEKELKIVPYEDDDIAVIMLSSRVFDPSGKRLALGMGVDVNKDGRHDFPKETMQAILYDLATDKITKVGAPAPVVVASFDRTGKALVLISADVMAQSGTMYTTPADKVKLRQLGLWGLPRGICPTADVLALLLPPKREPGGRRKNTLVLFDLAKDKIAASLPVREGNTKLDDYCPHWTVDGRYLYYVGVDREPKDDGSTESKYESRIWDRIKGELAPEVPGMIPLGPGPTATTMVLCSYETRDKLAVHDAAGGKTWTVAAPALRPIGSEGRYILYVKPGKDGKDVLCRGRITLPGS